MKGKIKQIVEDYVASVIKAVMAEHRVGERDFRRSNFHRHIKARTAAIKRLHDDGFSQIEISRFMHIDPKTVERRFNPKLQAKQLAARKRLYYAKKHGASSEARP